MEPYQKQKIELEIQEKELDLKDFLASFSKTKRITVITLVILIIPIFFIAKYTVAQVYMSDYAKNTELPAHPSNVSALPVKIIEASNLQIAGNAYSSYALIKNQNKDLAAQELRYVFHLFNSSGKEIYTYNGKSFLLGGEQKYLILPNVRLNEAPTKITVEVMDPVWQKRLDVPNVILKTGIPEYGDQTNPEGFYVKGNVENQSPYRLGTVVIKAVLFDKNHKVVGVTEYNADTVESKELRAYKMFWPVPFESLVNGVPQVTAETNVLDPSNLK